MTTLLLETVTITLLGVMFPGPITAATLTAGIQRRHAGLWIAVGHGLVEVPLIVLLAYGIGEFLEGHRSAVTAVVGSAGGLFLLWMGVQGLRDLGKAVEPSESGARQHPLRIGVVLTAFNPYFLVWWATVGLALIAQGLKVGMAALGLFIVVHWLCDLVWLEVLSLASHRGAGLLGGRRQKAVLGVCAAALVVFGCLFLYDAAREGYHLFGAP